MIGQAVCKSATDIVHKAAHIQAMSRDVKLREMLGEAAPIFFAKGTVVSGLDDGKQSGSSIQELEANLIMMINQWLKNLAV
jgi:hypothetical protein